MIKFLNKRNIVGLIVVFLVIVAFAYFYANRVSQPGVLSTDPRDGAIEVLETSQISITFDKNIQEKAKEKVSVSFDPHVDFDSTWLSNTYKVVPKQKLQNNQKYMGKVFFGTKEIYSFSFETATFSQEDIKKYGPAQAENDYAFGQALIDIVNKYPWYPRLPIKTSDYVIYYDFDSQKFAITFLTNKTPDQEKILIQEALTNIQKLGIKETIQYYVNNPQP